MTQKIPLLSAGDLEVLKKYQEIMSRPEIAAIAQESCTTDRMNGVLEKISAGKSGRAWLNGEWQLCELDALCQHIRYTAIKDEVSPDDFISTLLNYPGVTMESIHEAVLDETGFWGKEGAGALFLDPFTKRVGIGLRSQHTLQPNTWGTIGGALDHGETIYDAIRRELIEELGVTFDLDDLRSSLRARDLPIYESPKGDFKYTTLLIRCDWEKTFTPSEKELAEFRWFTLEELDQMSSDEIHFGLKFLLDDTRPGCLRQLISEC